LSLSRPQRSSDFAKELDSGGWDEVLFSVKPGRIDACNGSIDAIPDHGDLLSSEWAVDVLQVDAANNLDCAMSTNGAAGLYHFSRHIHMSERGAGVDFHYLLRNNSGTPLPSYWCAHPLFSVEGDAVIEIDGRMPMRVEDSANHDLSAGLRWPELATVDGETLDLSRSYAHNGGGPAEARKVFVKTPDAGVAAIKLPSGECLTVRVDANELPWLGLWINNGAWSGCGSEPYTNLGLEPATTPYDCVNEAIDNESVAWLQPGEEQRWQLSVELGT